MFVIPDKPEFGKMPIKPWAKKRDMAVQSHFKQAQCIVLLAWSRK